MLDVGNNALAIFAPGARMAALARLAQAGDQLSAQLSARHRVERGGDGLVADLKGRLVRVHPSQYARDLFGRIALAQQALDMAPQRAIRRQAPWASGHTRQRIGALLRERCTIAPRQRRTTPLLRCGGQTVPAVSFQLTTDRTGRALHAAGNCPQRAALLKTQLDHRAFFTAQMLVVRFHRNTLPPGKCCTSYLRPTTEKPEGPDVLAHRWVTAPNHGIQLLAQQLLRLR